MTKIDKDVAIPIAKRGGTLKYPWPEMEVGDSFFFAEGAATSAAASAYGIRHNKKFTTRKVDGGVRVWRIE